MIELIELTIIVFLSALIDYGHWIDFDYIESHKSRLALRTSIVLIIFIQCVYMYDLDFMNVWHYKKLLGLSLYFASTFDNTLNLMSMGKRGLFYLGTTASWDKFWTSKIIVWNDKKFNKDYTDYESINYYFKMIWLYRILVPISLTGSIYLIIT